MHQNHRQFASRLRSHVASDDPETVEIVERSLGIVAQLAVERGKPWPRRADLLTLHTARIAGLEAELARAAEKVDGVTGNELEQLGRVELRHRGHFLPKITPVPDAPSRERRDAEADLGLARDELDAERRRRTPRPHHERVLAQRVADLEQKVASL